PQPASATGRRIVVAYASNPLTNGNGTNQTGAVGNHTPQDVWVAAEDNTDTHAKQLTGKGLLDNTSVTPLMADFLNLSTFASTLGARGASTPQAALDGFQLSPVPFESKFQVSFVLPTAGPVTVELFNEMGQKVQTVEAGKTFAPGAHTIMVDGSRLKSGLYVATVTMGGQVVSKKTIKL
ncbi:MAG: T9SS type A sorting domain-containing protein, partial [Hymenobacter sp.]